MKNEVIKVKQVTQITNTIKNRKVIFRIITDACVKIAVLKICSEKKTWESVAGTFKNITTVVIHCWYIKDAFTEFCQQIFEQNISQGISE